jgi:signal transduction histidine kinase
VTAVPYTRSAIPWHRRLEARVAISVIVIAIAALTTVLVATSTVVTEYSLSRSRDDVSAARAAFTHLVNSRTAVAAAQARLVAELPVLRDTLAGSVVDEATIAEKAADYRQKLGATFSVIGDQQDRRVGSSGIATLSGREIAAALDDVINKSRTGQPADTIVTIAGDVFLIVSEPARFGEEILGTFTAGYRLDDAVAHELAVVTGGDVSFVCGGRVCGSSLEPGVRSALASLITSRPADLGRLDEQPALRQVGGISFVGGVYSLLPGAAAGSELVLLQDWRPTEHALSLIRRVMAAIGLVALGIALAGAVVLSRRTTKPLRDLAGVANQVASGQWSEQVPVEGPAEARIMAGAFNHMTVAIRQREDQLRQAQKMEAIGRLAGGVAHDFNNLLTAILGYADLLIERLDDPDARDQVNEIRQAGRSAASLTKDLLAFSRKQVMQPVVLDLNQVVTSAENLLGRVIGEDVDLVVELDRRLATVKADRVQIEQVLVNLAVNARDAMPDGGRLTMTTAMLDARQMPHQARTFNLTGPHVTLVVSDTGTGMSDDVQAHIFEPFFTTKGAGRGTGLGLATVYGIVKQSGGHIWVESALGHGSTFTVALPAAAVPADQSEAAEPRHDQRHHGTETVLLVEDNDLVRAMAREALVRFGYRVIEAPDGQVALRLATESVQSISVLLTDVVMPVMGGRELAGRLRALRPDLKIVFTSGYASDPVLGAQASALGAKFLQKPFSPALLGRTIREILDATPALP